MAVRKCVQQAVIDLYERLGTWKDVAAYLKEYDESGGTWYPALVNQVALYGVNVKRVVDALAAAGLTPDYRDRRKTRAWHGTAEEAEILDSHLEYLGYDSLAEFVRKKLVTNGEHITMIVHTRDSYGP